MMTRPRIDAFRPDDALAAGWPAVGHRPGDAVPDDPMPADYQCLLARRNGIPVARLAAGFADDMTGAAGRSGLIGWYQATDGDAGAALLERGRELLASGGAERILGPINASTWQRYRLALPHPSGIAPCPFLTEPQNPSDYPDHFLAAGFAPAMEYESRIVRRPEIDLAAHDAGADRLREAGITTRSLNLDSFDAEIEPIFRLSASAFAENPFFTPIPFAAFRATHERMRDLLDPALIRLAHAAAGPLLGFVFAFRDPLAQPSHPRIILKTLATAPDARGLGLGGFLTNEIHLEAARQGSDVIHALMQITNHSTRISSHHRSELFRGYTLYVA